MKTLSKILIVMLVITVAIVMIYSDYTEKISNFKIIAWAMVLVTAVAYNFVARQWYYSRKAVFYVDSVCDKNEGNRAITLAPGPDIVEGGYYRAYPGVSAYVSSSPPYDSVVVSMADMVYPGRNVVFMGERSLVSPEQLLEYLKGNKNLHQKILDSLSSLKKIYVVFKLPYHIEKGFYSAKGGYPIGTDKFDAIMPILYRHVMGSESLSKAMTLTFNDSLAFSQNTMQTFRRISEDVNTARKTGVPQTAEKVVLPGNERT